MIKHVLNSSAPSFTLMLTLLLASFISSSGVASAQCLTTDATSSTDVTETQEQKTPIGYRERLSQTVDISELNWADVLQARVQEANRLGLFAQKRREKQKVFEALATTPKNLGLARSESEQTEVFELTRFEGLQLRSDDQWMQALTVFKRHYLFVDFSDALQLVWAQAFFKDADHQKKLSATPVKVVAVGGSLPTATKSLKRRIYYDQQRRLTDKFFVSVTPTLVTLYADEKPDVRSIRVMARRQTFDMPAFEFALEQKKRQTRSSLVRSNKTPEYTIETHE